MILLRLIILLLSIFSLTSEATKVLHVSFHKGCINNFEAVARELGLELTNFYIHDLSPYEFDGYSKGNVIYNITKKRSEKVWEKHKDFFNSHDVIVVSDTTPLSRIFLQNEWSKPLIVWICNRFDYADRASLDESFPDSAYYELLKTAAKRKNVKFIFYNEFEREYAIAKGVHLGDRVIKPYCAVAGHCFKEKIEDANKNLFFILDYHNNIHFINLQKQLQKIGIPAIRKRYSSPYELTSYRGIIHIPGAWSNLHLYENLSLGIVYFVPSIDFLNELRRENESFFMPDIKYFDHFFALSEWYSPSMSRNLIYFNSWSDLVLKVYNTNEAFKKSEEIKQFIAEHNTECLEKWRNVFCFN